MDYVEVRSLTVLMYPITLRIYVLPRFVPR